VTNLLRQLALRMLGIADHDDDIRLLGDAVIALGKRVSDLEALIAEFYVGAPAAQEAEQ
jgi:hypothetical protein